MAIFHQENTSGETSSKGGATNDALKNFLRDAAASPEMLSQNASATFLARQICVKLFDTLLRPIEDDEEIDTSLSLSDAGLDSLIAIEMRSWWKQTFGFDISVLEMLGMGSMNALGEHATKGLAMKFKSDVGVENKEDGQDHGYVGKYARYLTEDALKAVMPTSRIEGSNGDAGTN
jgi:acyl carrier protein